MNIQNVHKWRREFPAGGDNEHNQHSLGTPKDVSTSDAIASVHALVKEDRCLTVWYIDELMYTETCIGVIFPIKLQIFFLKVFEIIFSVF